MTRARSLIRNILGGIGFGLALACPADAQALGDANCPGGYYFDPGYRVCVPMGYVYAPEDYGYDPGYGYAPPYYGQYYVFIDRRHRDHDRDRHRHDDHDRSGR